MSSKRNLYKPAPAALTPQMAVRWSLPQGRLTSTDPRSVMIPASPGVSESPNRIRTPASSQARRSLNYNAAMASRTDPLSTPSKQVKPTIGHSPTKIQRSASLSLSDVEDEPRKVGVNPATTPSSFEVPVLAVDASQRHSNRTDNEVPITASYIKSPAKVVCHSPKRKNTSEMTGSIHYGRAGKISIPVESVVSVDISKSAQGCSVGSKSPPSEDGLLSTVAGSPVDPRSKAVETVVVQEKNNPRSYVSFLDDGSDASVPLDQSDVHVCQPQFDDTGVSSSTATSKLDTCVDVTKRKKKKTRVVQSKYMSSAMSRIGDSKTLGRGDDQVSRSTALIKAKARSRKTKTHGNASKSSSVLKETGNESLVTDVKKPLHTSTPAEYLQQAMITEGGEGNDVETRDWSAVSSGLLAPARFTPTTDKTRSKTKKEATPNKENKSERPSQTRSGKHCGDEANQLQLDLQYAELCQWRFLRLKARDTFKKQEKDAQEWFYLMSQINEEMAERNHELEMKLAMKKKEEEIDRQLELQLSVLRNLDAQTRRLFPDYDKLYAAIDTTRHHLPLNDILVTQNEDEILAELNEYGNKVEELLELVQHNESKILSFSDEMQALAEHVHAETEEHERCTELLAAANSLATQEQSLQAELLDRK